MNDLRLAFRQMAKAPGFTATIVLTLALGIGGCLTMLAVLKATVLHDSDGNASRRLTLLRTPVQEVGRISNVSAADYLEWEQKLTSYEAFAAHIQTSATLTAQGEPLAMSGLRITTHWPEAVGCPVVIGRKFLPEEMVPGNDAVVIISYGLWQRVFGGADVIGRTIQWSEQLSDSPRTIVGIFSDEFKYAAALSEFAVPMALTESERAERESRRLNVRVLLKREVSLATAQSELDLVTARLASEYPETNKGVGALAAVHRRWVGSSSGPVIWTLFAAVTCVLLIACANVANLLLIRATRRRREICVRTALGASRVRIIRQLLVESLLLALAGGIGGLLFADWATAFVRSYPPIQSMRMLVHLELDRSMITFAVALSVITALLFGLAPCWFASRVDLSDALKQGDRGTTETGNTGRLRGALVIGEIATTTVLLTTAGLCLRSFVNSSRADIGFTAQHISTIELQLAGPLHRQPEKRDAFVASAIERLRGLAGVTAVGAGTLPLVNLFSTGFAVEGGPALLRAEWPRATTLTASSGYFEALGMRLLQGRFFSDQDVNQRSSVVINDVLARQYFPNTTAIGKRIKLATRDGAGAWQEIIGVVQGIMEMEVARGIGAQVFLMPPSWQSRRFSIIVRTTGNPVAMHSAFKRQIHAMDPDLPVTIRTLEERIVESGIKKTFLFHLLGAFSLLALVIATVGIYGVVAYMVSQRTTEIGIRMALGALPADVALLVFLQGGRLIVLGLAIGLGGALASGRLIESQLYQVGANDPLTLSAITLFFAAVAALACWLPARRATKVDPIVALRAE